jgi:hypothetical protein
MAQQLKKDKNGRWVIDGSDTQIEAQPYAHATPKPVAAKPKGKSAPKPWWHGVINELKYGVKQIGLMNAGYVPTGTLPPMASPGAMYTPVSYRNPKGGVSFSTPSDRLAVAAATVGAADNAAKFGYSMYQRHVERKPRANPDAGDFGRGLNQVVDATYRLMGAKPPSQQNSFERGFDGFGRSVGLNVAVGVAEAPLLIGAKALPLVGQALANPAIKGAVGFGLNEALSNYLDDNRGGNFVDLFNGIAGTKLPGGVDVGNADMVDAANQSLIPNVAASLVPGAALGAAFGSTKRFLKGSRTVEEVSNARGALEAAGLTQKAEDGRVAFTEQARQAPPPAPAPAAPAPRTPQEAEAGLQALIDGPEAPKAEPAPAPAAAAPAEAPLDPWAEEYDPSLPEADVVYRGLTQLDDAELQAAAQQNAPVVPTVDAAIASRPTPDLHPNPEGLAWQDITAPTVSLAPESIADYGRLKQDDLEAMVAVNPNLQQRITEATGRDLGEYTRQDIVDGLHGAAADGEAVIPRDFKQPTMRTDQINVDPQRFQYKQGVNADGEQLGNSLAGVGAWNPSMEGSVDIWQDPTSGQYFVVNGHNRLAKAKSLGIPTLKVNELMSPTAEAARAEGALSNMAQGSGTAFDAAKFFRDSPVPMDVQALEAAGVPMKSGMARQGLALSKLPGFAFQAAVDGELPIGKAVTLGESGLDEAGMTAAYKELKARPMGDAQFNEFLQITRSAGVVEGQVDLFGNADFVNTAAQKADLVASIKSLLVSNKKLFGTVGRNASTLEGAGNTIDKAGAKAISGEAARALTIFDQVKYEAGPVSDLLNEGAVRIANGEKAAVVAKQIQNRIANAIKQSMGAEPTLAGDVVQPDLMAGVPAAAAPEAVPAAAAIDPALMDKAFAHLSPAQREALRAQVMQKAIAGGEVRPPETPIPALPDGPAVSLKAAADDLRAGTVKPGSPAAQAIADEVRLRAEYAQQDADIRWQQEQALRDATNYEELTFDQKKAMGMGDDWFTPEADSRGMGRNFHGSANKIDKLTPGGEFNNDGMNIYGDGFYTTDDIATAAKYQKKNRKTAGSDAAATVYEVNEKQPVKLFDLDKDSSPAVKALLESIVEEGRYGAELIDQATQSASTGTLGEIMDQMRGWSRDLEIPAYEVQEFFQEIIDELRSEGYGGFTHAGGLKAGGGKRLHKVNIYWDPADAIGLKEMKPRNDFDVFAESRANAAAAPTIEIPAGASRKITARTSENRIVAAAESLRGWSTIPGTEPMSIDRALDLVRAKGAILDPDAIPGLDMTQARKDSTRGRATPEVQAAYEQFYGVKPKANAITPSEVINPEVLPPEKAPKIADMMKAMVDEMRASDERMLDSVLGSVQKVRTGLSQLQTMDFQLPRELSGSRTNWGGALLDFGSDLDKTAYILAGDAKGASKRAAKFREAVLDAGINLEALVEHGKDLKKRIKDYAGTSQPSNASGVVSIPDQGFVDNGAPSSAIQQRAQARLEANTQSIDNIRRKAQQEGC